MCWFLLFVTESGSMNEGSFGVVRARHRPDAQRGISYRQHQGERVGSNQA